eukprot:m.880 g.880  ORF g.880 m.880 type:complete len:404 (+) comp5058_c0_seq1:48-1259(+)
MPPLGTMQAFRRTFLPVNGRLFSSALSSSGIVSARVNAKNLQFTVQGESELNCSLPFAYALEHGSKAKGRLSRSDILSAMPLQMHVSEDASFVTVDWSTGAKTKLSADWLERHFNKVEKEIATPFHGDKIHWASEYGSQIKKFDFQQLLDNDDHLVEFFTMLGSYGLVMIENAKAEGGQLSLLADRLGWIKSTFYGDVLPVQSVENFTNLANTTIGLDMHGDLPQISYTPGFQFLHCIKQVSGSRAGAGWYCDGFAVANHMRRKLPDDFGHLSKSTIQFQYDVSDYHDFDAECWDHVIRLDRFGELEKVSLTNSTRGDRFSNKTKSELFGWYLAYCRYVRLVHNSQFMIEVKMKPGQIVVFDNLRVLHGRPEFQQKKGESRYLELIYIDKDAMCAKAREVMSK